MESASVQNETSGRSRPARTPWTEADNAAVRSLWRRGAVVATISQAVQHPFGTVKTQLYRLGLRDLPRASIMRDRIVELARDGWTVSRIARQCGVQESVVERVVTAAGLVPKVLYSYGRGRYGDDLPMPAPGAPEAHPGRARSRPGAEAR